MLKETIANLQKENKQVITENQAYAEQIKQLKKKKKELELELDDLKVTLRSVSEG